MKKLILATAIVLGGLSTMNAQAQETTTPAQTQQAAPATDEFKEIKVEEVPAAVTESLKKAYPDAVINKAHMNGKNEYQLDVKVGDKEGALYADKTGKWIQK
ncbi:hypothetical protein ACSV4D_10530 [Flavobacterium sp. ARAG 55.4]|uniref:Beta-lactamase-inhibitor-like, PepSY-like n=1 Tax=Flavobacterium plantiphilum TaxID=3163297 RepID=A0ABW8XQ95_9FLAO